jgi:N-dimethylarginine dimethylaminohydrolase
MPDYGTRDEYSNLRALIMCPPVYFEIDTPINKVQQKWQQLGRGPDPAKKLHQYGAVKRALESRGVDVHEIKPSKKFPFQVFTRDAGVITQRGAFISRFKRDLRMGEEQVVAGVLQQIDLDITHPVEAPGVFEGGDFVFLDHARAFVGIGDRTDTEGFDQIKARMPFLELYPVPFPEGFLHLDVVLNIISPNTALAYPEALPTPVLDQLRSSGFRIIPVPETEQETMGTNVLAIGDGTVISASCNRKTNSHLRKHGFTPIEIEMSEIIKGGGGPRCMTLPVWRV